MDIYSCLSLIGGLALFLYGMNVMSAGLEKLAGGKLEQILRRLTSNRFKGLALGAGVTAVIQSSSAVTVMLVGLVNSGILQLPQAVSVTMGSNIGTTITAWLLSLAGIRSSSIWVNLLKPVHFAPIVALIGILLLMACKKQKRRDAGSVCLGFAVLMFGMDMMSNAVAPLSQSPSFAGMLTAFENPLLGVLVGLVFTAVIQSSSASVGVLQALAVTGSVSFAAAIPIIMGQNIGTCVSALLSSVGTNKNARRVAVVHTLFNVIGTVICLTGWCIADAVFDFSFSSLAVTPFYIAVLHSVFNLTTTVLLFPFLNLLVKLSHLLVPDAGKKDSSVLLDDRLLTVPAFAVAKSVSTTVKMAEAAEKSVSKALGLLDNWNDKTAAGVEALENELDSYEDQLGTYLVKLSRRQISEEDSRRIAMLLHSISDFERIGDHALNLLAVAREMQDKKLQFSFEAKEELEKLTAALFDVLSAATTAFAAEDAQLARQVEPMEQVVDTLIARIRSRHVARLQSGNCTIELGFVLTDLLNNLERISDHCSNIAVAVIDAKADSFDSHAYLRAVKEQADGDFARQYAAGMRKYALRDEKTDLTQI